MNGGVGGSYEKIASADESVGGKIMCVQLRSAIFIIYFRVCNFCSIKTTSLVISRMGKKISRGWTGKRGAPNKFDVISFAQTRRIAGKGTKKKETAGEEIEGNEKGNGESWSARQ